MFTPAMGFYSQTCKRAKDLAFHSRPGTLEMNLFLYLFLLTEHFVAEKSAALYKYISVGVPKWAQSDIWRKYRLHAIQLNYSESD